LSGLRYIVKVIVSGRMWRVYPANLILSLPLLGSWFSWMEIFGTDTDSSSGGKSYSHIGSRKSRQTAHVI
jgi:hypothetical protein